MTKEEARLTAHIQLWRARAESLEDKHLTKEQIAIRNGAHLKQLQAEIDLAFFTGIIKRPKGANGWLTGL